MGWVVEASWNVMTRAETRFRLSAKRTSPFKSTGASVQSTTGSRGVRICGSNTGYTMFRGSVEGTGYPLHSPVSPSLPLPCVSVCHHVSTVLNHSLLNGWKKRTVLRLPCSWLIPLWITIRQTHEVMSSAAVTILTSGSLTTNLRPWWYDFSLRKYRKLTACFRSEQPVHINMGVFFSLNWVLNIKYVLLDE